LRDAARTIPDIRSGQRIVDILARVDGAFSKPFSPVFPEDDMARAIFGPRGARAISAEFVSALLAISIRAGIL
jgi:hypothetical protein